MTRICRDESKLFHGECLHSKENFWRRRKLTVTFVISSTIIIQTLIGINFYDTILKTAVTVNDKKTDPRPMHTSPTSTSSLSNNHNNKINDDNSTTWKNGKTLKDKKIIPGQMSTSPVFVSGLSDNHANETNDNNNNNNAFLPQGCTWQCYLRQNSDLMINVKWSEAAALEHYNQYGKYENRVCSCKVILLAGPHKAASTTLQKIAIIYSNMGNIPWHWIDPDGTGGKSFFQFINAFSTSTKNDNDTTFQRIVKPKFQAEIHKYFNSGYNIILGSEEIDRIALKNPGPYEKLLDEILSILPHSIIENDFLTTIVVYRSPRIKHLHSVFKQVSQTGNIKDKNFYQFLQNLTPGHLNAMLTLPLTDVLVKKGLKVGLLDMTTLIRMQSDSYNETSPRYDFYSVLGCQIMQLPCKKQEDQEWVVPTQISERKDSEAILKALSTPSNVRVSTVNWNVTESQVHEIENLLQEYDCVFANVLSNQRLMLFHGKGLIETFKQCGSRSKSYTSKLPDESDLIMSIKQVVG